VDGGPFIAIGVFTLLIAAANLLIPSRAKRVDRALAAKPRALVEEAEGTVRLAGRVRRIGDLLQAPLSGRPCVAYELCVNESGQGGPESSGWYRLIEMRQACPFVVADESGEARVDTDGPFRIAVTYDRTGTTRWFGEYPGIHRDLARFLKAEGYLATGWFGRWKVFHYAEGVIEEDQLVTVGGASAREFDAAGRPPDRRSPPERLVLRGTDAQPLLISETAK
jgi:hypothetical protein